MSKHTIIYAEDDIDDVMFVTECFKKYDGQVDLMIASNGSEVLELLDKLRLEGTSPCLIILDVNMPMMDGRQTLVQLKQHDLYKKIPVVMFTTSSSSLDKEFAKKWGADFITKPLKYAEVEGLASEFTRRCDMEMHKRP